jgi:hypothetical protein
MLAICSHRHQFTSATLWIDVLVDAPYRHAAVPQVRRYLPQTGACIERMAAKSMPQHV